MASGAEPFSVDTSKISTDDLVRNIIEWMFGQDKIAAAVELDKEIRGDRNAGDEPTVERLAGYVLRAIGSQESVASYLEYQLESEYGEED
ncbi:MAG: hypothetical protein OXG68_11560 [Chloroflexi bacterium]|nr:hypothetical protein [Chloroflexota bacterium]